MPPRTTTKMPGLRLPCSKRRSASPWLRGTAKRRMRSISPAESVGKAWPRRAVMVGEGNSWSRDSVIFLLRAARSVAPDARQPRGERARADLGREPCEQAVGARLDGIEAEAAAAPRRARERAVDRPEPPLLRVSPGVAARRARGTRGGHAEGRNGLG